MNNQKIALFGTTGEVTRRVAEEALKRGHSVTIVVRDASEFNKIKDPKLIAVSGDVMSPKEVSTLLKGHSMVICLHEPTISRPHGHVEANRSLIQGVKSAGLQHLVSLGHPVSLNTEGAKSLYDSWKLLVEAQKDTLALFQNEKSLYWGYVHTTDMGPDKKSGRYPVSNELLLSNPLGQTQVNINVLASVLLDEAEKTEFAWEETEMDL